jgi:hypothetical protein
MQMRGNDRKCHSNRADSMHPNVAWPDRTGKLNARCEPKVAIVERQPSRFPRTSLVHLDPNTGKRRVLR